MLMFHDGSPECKKLVPNLASNALPSRVTWVDVLDGTPEEIGYIERVLGRHLPTLAELKEIESSSRLRYDNRAFCLSAPVVSGIPAGQPMASPVGFILTRDVLVTIRFEELMAFSAFGNDYAARKGHVLRGTDAFVGLVNAIVDRAADVLEIVGGELDEISQNVFYANNAKSPRRHSPAQETRGLKHIMRRIGYNGTLSSKIRDSLLGVGRLVRYVADLAPDWFSAETKALLDAQHHDVVSLSDYDAHLMSKVQLLLDATMGLIGIEQNDTIKVLTIVSVVGVPPTLVASIYGMNFHFMPELDWAWGYPFGILLIVLSALVPVAWFKARGWL